MRSSETAATGMAPSFVKNETRKEFRRSATMVFVLESRSNFAVLGAAAQDRSILTSAAAGCKTGALAAGKIEVTALTGRGAT